ncbi:TRAP transporter, solute receptor, TAXI family [Desulfosarcina cetonica]|uniref:TAXI family TRAP transporter solute-binding subunit n=1 Tax=Desulfosarcina cetonica TaxID=90730 RepID=UPI0006D1C411|nr:TAXI family TRAP transporter solute-binding subunit [Desulfosarcina cetonica]VTR70322.1 TRAP transporter, solute receptor, TAXI family [Desulfosarcina cetonica]
MKKIKSFASILYFIVVIFLFQGIGVCDDTYKQITISGGTAGGAWGAVTEGLAEAFRQGIPGLMVSTTPGTDATNFMRLEKGVCELALGVAATGLRAIKGRPPFNSKTDGIMGITALFEEPFQFVILNKTGIKTFNDILKLKYPLRHSPNKKGNFMEILCDEIFKEYGFSYDLIKSWGGNIVFNSYSQSINLIRSGSLDSLSGCSLVPTTHFQELSGTHDIDLLSLSDDVILKLEREFGIQKKIIPESSYKFLNRDISTVASRNILACDKKLPDALVYEMTKTIYEKRSYLAGIHVALKNLEPAFMASLSGIPLHPGAEKFYKEIGAIK